MTANKLHAAAAAFLLGTAVIGAGALLTAAPAQAATVRPEVGKPLQEAQGLAAAGSYKAAMAKVDQAEAVANKTPAEEQIIKQMKDFIAVKSGDASFGALGAKAAFANDYNAHNYAKVIADADALKKTGALDAQSMQVVAQAYYQSGNKTGCIKYIKNNFGSSPDEATLSLLVRCAYDANDEDTQRDALEQLVSRTGKAEYWTSLLKLSERTIGLSDHQTLDIYRLKLLTGTIATKDEYTLLAQLSIQLGFPAEAVNVIQKAMANNMLNDAKSNRLLALAKQQAAANDAGRAAALAAAQKAPQGDALIKIAEDDWGNGKYNDAIDAAQAGLKKDLKDKDNAQTVLGMAYIGAGQKEAAIKDLKEVNAKPNGAMIAHLWSLYASSGQGMKAAASEKPARKKH